MKDFFEKIKARHLIEWVLGTIAFTVGLMLVLFVATSNYDFINVAGIILGVVFIIIGALGMFFAITEKKLLSLSSLCYSLILALGIASVCENLSVGIITLAIGFCPYFLIVFGAILIVNFIIESTVNKQSSQSNILIFLMGCIALLVGILILAISALRNNINLIGGIVIMIASITTILNSYFNFTNRVVKSVSNKRN